MDAGPARIAVRGLTRSFGRAPVLEGLDLSVAPGETVAVLGASGSGKTTLLRLVAGLELPDAGEIDLDGAPASRPGWGVPPHRRGIGFAFQRSALWPHLTVAANIGFGLHGLPRDGARAHVSEWLERMDLAGLGDRYPDQLSGGQARRVALARALAPEPRTLLLDEALTNLEPDLRTRLLELVLAQAARTGASLVYVTHDPADLRRVAGRALRLAAGRVTPVDEFGEVGR